MNIASVAILSKKELFRMQERIDLLESQVHVATEFVKEIEKGNWNAGEGLGIGTTTASSVLTDSLLSLCNQLKSYSLSEKERNWVSEGLAQFIDILRSKNDDIHELTDNIIRSLVKYMNVNQGALYLINDEDPKDEFIEMAACYAYNRKKHLEQRINLGEGLTGQAVMEKDTIYLSDIPKNYVMITSGLGEALPNHILIVPLKIEEKVFGVVEIAAFEAIQRYRIEFVERLAESIASTLASVKNGQKTQVLLKQSQTQTEMMRSQEEEMRQNMEELNATQEEMQRVLKGAQNKEKYLNEIINAPKDSIYILDKNYKILSYNKMFGTALEQMLGVQDLKGFAFLDLFPNPADKKKQKDYMNRAFAGENFDYTQEYTDKGVTSHHSTNYAPLKDEDGAVYAIAGFSKDITELVNLQKRTEELLNESKHQTEELKTQEEELRQNMEELSATQDEIHRVLSAVQSKERYMNELINASSDAILTADENMRVINCNTAFKKSYGGAGLEIEKGFDLNNLFQSEEDKVKYAGFYKRVFQGESFKVDEDFSYGEVESFFSIQYSPIRNEEGNIIAAAVFVNDVTQMGKAKKEVEKLLADTDTAYKKMEQKEKYLNDIINAPKDSIYILDKDYKILDYNTVFGSGLEQILGMKDLRGFCLLDLFTDEKERNRQKEIMDQAFAGESVEHTSAYEAQGVTSHYNTNYAALKNEAGETYAIVAFSKDVTALVNAQKEVEKLLVETSSAYKDMAEKERQLNELINVPNDSIFTLDKNYKIVSFNNSIAKGVEQSGVKLEKGFDMLSLLGKEEQALEISNYKKAFKGESFEVINKLTVADQQMWFAINYAPLHDADGNISQIAIFSKDVTALYKDK